MFRLRLYRGVQHKLVHLPSSFQHRRSVLFGLMSAFDTEKDFFVQQCHRSDICYRLSGDYPNIYFASKSDVDKYNDIIEASNPCYILQNKDDRQHFINWCAEHDFLYYVSVYEESHHLLETRAVIQLALTFAMEDRRYYGKTIHFDD